MLEYRTLAKLKSTYVDGLMPLINEQRRQSARAFQPDGDDDRQDQLHGA